MCSPAVLPMTFCAGSLHTRKPLNDKGSGRVAQSLNPARQPPLYFPHEVEEKERTAVRHYRFSFSRFRFSHFRFLSEHQIADKDRHRQTGEIT